VTADTSVWSGTRRPAWAEGLADKDVLDHVVIDGKVGLLADH
jgi:hypothetical protein